MVGFVIVSHSRTLADGVVELTSMMAAGVPIRAAGGLDDGSFGTSYEKISDAIDEIYSDDGVIVLMDMGSAVMTAEMVLESMPERKLVLADCPLVEGAVAATVSAIAGSSMEEILDELQDVRELKKSDVVVLAEIYAARERNTIGISSAQLAEQIPGAVYCETLPDVTAYLRENVREGDIVVTMGAGDIFRAGEALISGEQ